MQVLKFGGTSMSGAANIKKVVAIVKDKTEKEKNKIIVVASAMSGVTDLLLQLASLAASGNEAYKEKLSQLETMHMQAVRDLVPVTNQSTYLSLVKKTVNEVEEFCHGLFVLQELTPRAKDRIASYGELLSTKLLSARLAQEGVVNTWKDSRDLIVSDSQFTNARPDMEATQKKVQEYFSKEQQVAVFVLPGFVAADKQGITTTLGRGGSDYTASIIAAVLPAERLEIWTDVSGMMTADPRVVMHARGIPRISYQEAMELTHFGAKIIYPPTIQPVMQKNIPLWIKNTFAPADEGTEIINDNGLETLSADGFIRGISSIAHLSLISLEGSGMVGIPGFSKRLFDALSREKINVILITQSSSEHSICVAIESININAAKKAVDEEFADEIALQKVDPLLTESDLAIVALVGEQMKSHPGIAGRMFSTLGRNGVNIRAIAQGSSEKNISAVIGADDVRKALNVLHEEFFETTYKQVNLFIAGAGNVGEKLLEQLEQQKQFLQESLRLQLKVVGLSNSRLMLFKPEGIDLANWKNELQNGEKADVEQFADQIIHRNLRNSIFVDITASETVAAVYAKLLRRTVSVVACNKIAASSAFENYQSLKKLAGDYNCHFLFETNVGAGLPVIATLNDLLRSGDKVRQIDAVLSGTLNFVFNNYDGNKKFSDVVRQAQAEGYTEPDPRLDLSGTDVMRKIMILAREAGEKIEMDDISNVSFMPGSCMKGSVEDFYTAMLQEEDHFKKLLDDAKAAGCKLKFVASWKDGKAGVGLQHIDPQHDLYHLYGKDNIVLFYTERYPEQPMIIKGAGAGAAVTASGVFADILRASKN